MRQAELLRCLVLAAQREGNLRLVRELRGLTLTPSQAELLRVLADRELLTLTGLGELRICESGTNLSRLVDRLVLAGLVQRVTASGDRGEVTLTHTPAGRAAEQGVRAVGVSLKSHGFRPGKSRVMRGGQLEPANGRDAALSDDAVARPALRSIR